MVTNCKTRAHPAQLQLTRTARLDAADA